MNSNCPSAKFIVTVNQCKFQKARLRDGQSPYGTHATYPHML